LDSIKLVEQSPGILSTFKFRVRVRVRVSYLDWGAFSDRLF
jgi:hypothetical protein